DAAIAVENTAARRNDRNRANAVALGHLAILIGVDDLQLPEAEQQHTDHAYDDVGHSCQPLLRQPIVATKGKRHANPAREPYLLRSGFRRCSRDDLIHSAVIETSVEKFRLEYDPKKSFRSSRIALQHHRTGLVEVFPKLASGKGSRKLSRGTG